MKKKVFQSIGILIFVLIVIMAIYNIYNWIVCGNQYIAIKTLSKTYTNSDLYVYITLQNLADSDLDTKFKLNLLDNNEKKVKDVDIKYDGNIGIIHIPELETGNYYIEANVSSKLGKDTVQKEIYIVDGKRENVTITLDKGIYKPGDTVNYRALLTDKENDEPVSKDINISIYDGNDNKVYNENLKSSDYGITSGSFKLADEVNSGLYKLVVKDKNEETIKQFKVNPYVTPKYEVNINFDKENYLVGGTAKITFDAKYFFGEAVQDAELTVYVNNKKYKTIKTDMQGKATLDYEIKNVGTYEIQVEAVDSSNYFVETVNSFVAGTDQFEIQLLPEYGTLIAGKMNDVYVFTNKADGTPVKTYVTVSSDNFVKQIATDENGIGKFSIDINQEDYDIGYYSYYSYKKRLGEKEFNITAEDEDKNSVNKNMLFDIEQKSLLLSTDKVKYEQGEDIKLDIFSISENEKTIYFFKNNKLIKMISTDFESTTVNLEDVYGLIDIYVTEKTDRYSSSDKYKKTIFIKPTKQLNINVSTDKDEYKPGEEIAISFDTTDENKSGVNAALLISMLDNSVLSLANNDLSIDNIKLALQDIYFSNELDGATLYSCILDDSSEQTMMGLLLKQKGQDVNISEKVFDNEDEKEQYAGISIALICIIVFTIVTILCVKFKKFRVAMKHIINLFVISALAILIILSIMYYDIDEWWQFAIIEIIIIALYIVIVYKFIDMMFRTSLSIIITCLVYVLLAFLINGLDISFKVIGMVFAVTLLVIGIVGRISEAKKLKIHKYMQLVNKEIIYIIKYLATLGLSLFILYIAEKLDIDYELAPIVFTIMLIAVYYLNYAFNIIDVTNKKFKTTISVLSIVGTIILCIFLINFMDASTITNDAVNSIESINGPSIGSSGISSSSLDGFLSQNWFTKNDDIISIGDYNHEQENETIVDNNVRKVFLESMCFIPELVTSNGIANLDLNLSDNITTWTIQAVGNTKDGRIGYGMINDVKVFKDFFVDFELPKNLVETDKVSIPVTVYNYTDSPISTTLKIKQEDWFATDKNNININVNSNSTNMVYVPISVLKAGNNRFRVEVSSNTLTDIVEKECIVSSNGYKIEKVVSAGSLDEDISEDILVLDDIIENSAKARVKIYSNTISQTIEGMENIFRMPTGCFEQISSSLYPNILALKYMEDNGIVNKEIKEKALSYISSGYQKLLTYEVEGESGGYSLYGYSPAETVLTAYGLMEVSDLSEVYNVDENVINKMTEFLYKKQNYNGTFEITGYHIGGAGSRETLALNAYIIWALSESNPNDERLQKSVDYLKDKLDKVDDSYTLALIANVLANVKDKELNNVLKRLVDNIKIDGNVAYITSSITDYYGSRYSTQTIQTVALTSMALSKGSYNPEVNKMLINYLIGQIDVRGTWYSTQATILALKALNERNGKSKLENQTIVVKLNSNEQTIEIKDNPLDLYELTFENLNKENKLNIDIEKGSAYYEVIEEYYIPFERIDTQNDNIKISVECDNNLKVNEILKPNIKVINQSENSILNGMVTISIPQGFTVVEEDLMVLENKGIIEKYETSYREVNLYLRNFDVNQIVNLNIGFRASYPVEITGMSVKAYDYYNPTVEGKTMPIKITVK